ncbi:PAX-interacting protein 1 [Gonapodya sp. JEL0774]|nr:PAX-interacting protein 1 [Gonapodya sp. JEL0774]
MVEYIGAKYTSSLTPRNTHCICAEPTGDKYTHCLEWNIEVVTHRWLEDTLSRLKVQPLSRPEYSFVGADRTALEGIAGRKAIEVPDDVVSLEGTPKKALVQPTSALEPSSEAPANLRPGQTTSSEAIKDVSGAGESSGKSQLTNGVPPVTVESVTTDVGKEEKSQVTTAPPAPLSTPTSAKLVSETAKPIAQSAPSLPAVSEPKPSSTKRKPPDQQSPNRSKRARPSSERVDLRASDKEVIIDHTPSTNAVATARSPPPASTPVRSPSAKSSTPKRQARAEKSTRSNIREGLVKSSVKKPAIIETGTRLLTKSDWKNIVKIGGTEAASIEEATHVVTNRVTRTEKFFAALCLCKFIVDPSWVLDSVSAGAWLDESAHVVKDAETEKVLKFNLVESMQRARRRKLLTNRVVCVTPSVLPSETIIKGIVENAGGKAFETYILGAYISPGNNTAALCAAELHDAKSQFMPTSWANPPRSTKAVFRSTTPPPSNPFVLCVRFHGVAALCAALVVLPLIALILGSLRVPRDMWGEVLPLAFIQHSDNPKAYWCSTASLEENDFTCYLRGPDSLERFLATMIGGPFGGTVLGLWKVDMDADVDVMEFEDRRVGSGLGLNTSLGGGRMLHRAGNRRLTALSGPDIRALFRALDTNGDGLLDFPDIMGSWDNWDHHKPWKLEVLLDRWKVTKQRRAEGKRTYGDGFGWWSDLGY